MSKKEPAYSIEAAEGRGHEPRETNFEVPVIDIVRHGPTDYKELKDPAFIFDPTAGGFELDAEHLDITEEGIEVVRDTARQLEAQIDREKEVVLIVSSPNFRARSTALVIEDEFRSHGVHLLAARSEVPITRSLRQISAKNPNNLPLWIAMDGTFRAEDERHRNAHPEKAHAEIAARIGTTIGEFFTEDYDKIGARFNRFLRHAANVFDYLSDRTKAQLSGKQLRIVAVTHEEVPDRFASEALGTKENIKQGQILEVRPGGKLRKGGADIAEVVLYPKGGRSESGEKTIVRRFTRGD